MGNFLRNVIDLWQRAGLVQRVVLLSVLLACGGAAALLVGWARQPHFALLYSGLAPEDAARIVEKVRDADVAYELRSGGTAVYVPEDKVYSLRLELAGQGLPAGDQRGYRILDEEKLGTSPFTQRLNYRRALEGEIAKSIQIIDGVVSARVHVVRPESSLFADKPKSASATVVLKLRPGWRLAPGNVAAIVHMVAGSVEDLKPEDVVVVDGAGNLLSGTQQDSLARGIGTLLDFKTRHEEYLARKVEDMLTQVLGPNRATVKVDVTLDNTTVTQSVENYDPDKRVVTKEELKTRSSSGGAAAGETAAPGETGNTKEETTLTDYLVGRTVKQETIVPGKVTSISVAAMVDLSSPRQPAAGTGGGETSAGQPAQPAAPVVKLADIESLIRSALGLKETDSLKVVEAPFYRPEAQVEAAEEQEASSLQFYLDIARQSSLGVLVVGALVALKIFSGPRKRASAGAAAAALTAPPSGATAAMPAASFDADPAMLRSRIAAALQENPEEVRRLFLAWVEGEKGGA